MASRELDHRPDDLLLSAREGAVETGVAVSTFWKYVKIGLLPPPYYVAPGFPRWRQSELRRTIDARRAPWPSRIDKSVAAADPIGGRPHARCRRAVPLRVGVQATQDPSVTARAVVDEGSKVSRRTARRSAIRRSSEAAP